MKTGGEKILVYSPNWIGDAVMSLPALKGIRRAFPRSEIHVLAVPWVCEIYSLSGIPDGIIPYDRNNKHAGLKGLLYISRLVKEHLFSVAFIFPNSWRSAVIPWLARIPVRVGLSRRYREIFFLTHSREPERDFKQKHQVYYYLSIVSILNPETRKYRGELVKTPFLDSTSGDFPDIASLAIKYGLDPRKLWFALAPGASYGDAKLWWPDRFSAVATRIAAEFGAQVIILGSSSDSGTASRIALNAKADVIDLTGKTTLLEAMGFLRHSRVLLTNDSGLMHVAAALGVPLVAIFGSTDPVRTGPFGDPGITTVLEATVECHPCFQRVCPGKGKICMTEIEVEDVMKSIRRLWSG